MLFICLSRSLSSTYSEATIFLCHVRVNYVFPLLQLNFQKRHFQVAESHTRFMLADAASTSSASSAVDGFACELCPPSIHIANRVDFAHHLRAVHCTKEGGSFICR
ncbi:hypothetical protein L596_022109 [Steinernema carpocapsae]|uniref:Uncharacterized protein n=1 Tax=Steinernema carpocapsae TaxID=34508 RepID=A0A4U5MKR1_STECR|nr:hypothetical protein L596_022109 [Steinernema carpocapsae]